MRWVTLAVVFFGIICAVVSADSGQEPSLKIMTRSSVYGVGEDKAFYCKGTNIGPEQMEWVSNKDTVVERRFGKNNRVYVESRSPNLLVLFVHDLTLEEEGNWVCRSKDLTINQTLNVIVGEKAEVDADETKKADESKSVKLSCKITKGVPPPVVKWYKENGSPIIGGNKQDDKYKLRHKNDVYTLEINKLEFTDEGNYLCKVTQERLSHHVSKTIKLEVQYKPVFIDHELNVLENQDGSGHSTILVEEFAVLNETKTLTCRAIANPPAAFKWQRRKNGADLREALQADMNPDGDGSSVLTLAMKDESDAGEYKCTAKNDMGSSNLIFHISLGEKPNAPDYISAVPDMFNHTFITFTVKCTNCTFMSEETTDFSPDPKNLPVTAYSFQLTKYKESFIPDWDDSEEVEVEIEDPKETNFAVGPISNSTTFHVRVRSKNAAGFSSWLEMDTSGLKPEEMPHTSHVVRLASTVSLLVTALFVILCY